MRLVPYSREKRSLFFNLIWVQQAKKIRSANAADVLNGDQCA